MSETSPGTTTQPVARRRGLASSRIERLRATRAAPERQPRWRLWLAGLVLCLALGIALFLDSQRGLASTPRALEVIAVDQLGQPLRDVAVRFFARKDPTAPTHESRTDEQGMAVLPAEKSDGEFYCVACLDDGTVSLAHVSQNFVRAAIPFGAPERIEGRVRDAAGREAVGARVEARLLEDGPPLETCTTDERGSFALTRVSAGLSFLTIRVAHQGHATAHVEWYRKTRPALDIELIASPGLRLQVMDPAGTPVPGVVVRVVDRDDLQATSDGEGRLAFPELDLNRSWHLKLTGELLKERTFRSTSWWPGASTQPLILEPPAVVEGHVVTSSGQPLGDIEVRHPHGPRAWVRTRTDRNGWFRIGDLPSGSSELFVEVRADDVQSRPVSVAAGEHQRGLRLVIAATQ
jgi:hypothetical protein